jgi:hypothetical protein
MLVAISRRFQTTRRDVAKAPLLFRRHQIVSASLSQSESPVAVDLRIHARNDGQPLARAPMVDAGAPQSCVMGPGSQTQFLA